MIRYVAHALGFLVCLPPVLLVGLAVQSLLLDRTSDPRSWYIYDYDEQRGWLLGSAAALVGAQALWIFVLSMARSESAEPPTVRGSYPRAFGGAALSAVPLLAGAMVLAMKRAIVGYDGDGWLLVAVPAAVIACTTPLPFAWSVREIVRLGATPAAYSVAGLRRVVFLLTAILIGVVLALLSVDELKGSNATLARAVATGLISGGVGGFVAPLFYRRTA